jgi:hypothetical protein
VRANRALALTILAILGLAVLAPVGLASDSGGAAAAEQRAAAAEQRAARRAQRAAEQQARAEARHNARAIRLAGKGAEVKIDCDSITVSYSGFPAIEGSPNSVLQLVTIKSRPWSPQRIVLPAKTFTFEGAAGTSVIPIAAPVGESTIALRSRWHTNGVHGGFPIQETRSCPPRPAFSIEQLQSLGGPFTTGSLPGAVGQTVLYQMIIANTGNVPLTFGKFSDAVCDPGTVAGLTTNPVKYQGTLTIVCAHTLSAADAAVGSVSNIAKITGASEEGEGSSFEHESNKLVVTPIEGGSEDPPSGGEDPPSITPTPKSGVLGTSGASTTSKGKSNVLGFSLATVPSLRGPRGCVRRSVTASVKSAGVKTVVFYLDGHRLRTLGPSAARKGLLSIRIDLSKKKAGAHRVKATITMKPITAGGKTAKASRLLTVVRCHSAVVIPHITR